VPEQPLELSVFRGVHDHDQVVAGRELVLGQQRDVVHDDGVRARLLLELAHPLPDQRVDDLVQPSQPDRIGEHDLAETIPVQAAIGPEHASTELGDHGRQPAGPRLHNLPGDGVRVDQYGALRGQAA